MINYFLSGWVDEWMGGGVYGSGWSGWVDEFGVPGELAKKYDWIEITTRRIRS